MAGTLTGPRRAVVVEDAAATTKSGKRKKADAAALAAQPGDHIVVLEKLRGSTYLVRGRLVGWFALKRAWLTVGASSVGLRTNAWQAVAQGKAGTIRRKHFAYLKKAEAPEFVLPSPAELEAIAAPVRAQLQSSDADGDACSPAGPQSPASPASPASPVLPVVDGAAPPPVETSIIAASAAAAPAAAAAEGAAPAESAQPAAGAPAPETVPTSDAAPAAASGDGAAAAVAPAVGPAEPAPPAPAPADVGAGLGSGDDDAVAGSAGPPTADAAATSPGGTIIARTALDDEHVDAYGFETDPTIEQDLGTYVASKPAVSEIRAIDEVLRDAPHRGCARSAPTPTDVARQMKWMKMLNRSWLLKDVKKSKVRTLLHAQPCPSTC